MDESQLIAVAAAEIASPTFGVMEQFLKIHSVTFEAGVPKVAGLSVYDEEQRAVVYFAVRGEKFYLAVSVALIAISFEVTGAWVEEWNRISFHATSETLDAEQLSSLTTLTPTDSWNKGEPRRFGGALRRQSSIEFEPNPGPGEFEIRLKTLLTFLEQDADGIRSLVEKAEGYLRVISVFHNGNTMLGGLHLDKECVRRMAALNLEIDFDLYAEGNFYKA